MGGKQKAESYLIRAYHIVGDEVFEPEDDLFKEMAMKEEQEDKQEEE